MLYFFSGEGWFSNNCKNLLKGKLTHSSADQWKHYNKYYRSCSNLEELVGIEDEKTGSSHRRANSSSWSLIIWHFLGCLKKY